MRTGQRAETDGPRLAGRVLFSLGNAVEDVIIRIDIIILLIGKYYLWLNPLSKFERAIL